MARFVGRLEEALAGSGGDGGGEGEEEEEEEDMSCSAFDVTCDAPLDAPELPTTATVPRHPGQHATSWAVTSCSFRRETLCYDYRAGAFALITDDALNATVTVSSAAAEGGTGSSTEGGRRCLMPHAEHIRYRRDPTRFADPGTNPIATYVE